MQATPDKDFNEAFRKKFDDFEMEPSAAVWNGIVSELDKIKKRSFPVYRLMAAASVLLVMSAGFWLFAPKERVRLQGKAEESFISQEDIQPSETIEEPENIQTDKTIKQSASSAFVIHTSSSKITEKTPEDTLISRRVENKPVREVVVAKNEERPVVKENIPVKVQEPPVFALANEVADEDTDKDKVSQRRLKTVGDLVNFVVGKIDPRTDKIIRFSNDGDGGSEVSGINLGLVKFKNRNK